MHTLFIGKSSSTLVMMGLYGGIAAWYGLPVPLILFCILIGGQLDLFLLILLMAMEGGRRMVAIVIYVITWLFVAYGALMFLGITVSQEGLGDQTTANLEALGSVLAVVLAFSLLRLTAISWQPPSDHDTSGLPPA